MRIAFGVVVRLARTMRNMLLGLVFLATTVGLAAKPLTFTFQEYQVEPVSMDGDQAFPLERLAGLNPAFSQTVELSAEGSGKAITTMGDSTITTVIRAMSGQDSLYQMEVKHEFVAAIAGGIPIVSSRGAKAKLAFKVGDRKVISTIRMDSDREGANQAQAFVLVGKLTD